MCPQRALVPWPKAEMQNPENKATQAAFTSKGYLSSKHNAQEEHKHGVASFLQLKSRSGSPDQGITPPNTCTRQ